MVADRLTDIVLAFSLSVSGVGKLYWLASCSSGASSFSSLAARERRDKRRRARALPCSAVPPRGGVRCVEPRRVAACRESTLFAHIAVPHHTSRHFHFALGVLVERSYTHTWHKTNNTTTTLGHPQRPR